MHAAADRWAEALESWAIPPELMAAAPEDPWSFPVAMFAQAADLAEQRESATQRRVLEALPAGGTVIDVGCGAGAMSVGLTPKAARIVGTDQSADMLAEFARRMDGLGVEHVEIEGKWPDVGRSVETGDVVVSGHVVYNIQDIIPFVHALDRHATRRVVIEMTGEHPRIGANPIWLEVHGITRPVKPTSADLLEILHDVGIPAKIEEWEESTLWSEAEPAAVVAYLRRFLCLTPDRDPDVRRALDNHPLPEQRPIATLWWDRDTV